MLRRAFSTPMQAVAWNVRNASTKGRAPRILITGGNGQVGTDLSIVLRKKYGVENVIVTDLSKNPNPGTGPYEHLNVLDRSRLEELVVKYDIDWMFHNAALMSVLGEQQPHKALELNIDGLRTTLEVARVHKLRYFCPSTMAVFGADAGKVMTKDDTILNPTTVYGITKVLLEQLGSYYYRKFGVDFRSVRLPGVISVATLPGGGTTDYAVHMYHYALRKEQYKCPVLADEPLPMMYVDDAIEGMVQLMEADRAKLTRCVYNIAGVSFTPSELKKSIEKFTSLDMVYERGIAQDIAHSWPDSMDDSNARKDWGWNPKFDLDGMTKIMLTDIPKFHPSVPAMK